jgi:hypothetical protein
MKTFQFVTDIAKNNSVDPEFIASELGHAGPNAANGALLAVRRVCDGGEVRRVFQLGNGRKVLRVESYGRTISIYENAEDIPAAPQTLPVGTVIAGFTYSTSRKDGLPTAFASRDCETSFKIEDVREWHVSREYGSAIYRLGATLADGRLVFVVRSQLPNYIADPLGKIAEAVRRNTVRHSGGSRSIQFWHGPALKT